MVLRQQLQKIGLSSILGQFGGTSSSRAMLDASSSVDFSQAIALKNVECSTHAALGCTRCDIGEGHFVEQAGHATEDDLNTWSHHTGVSGVDDDILHSAATSMRQHGSSIVSFAMGCSVGAPPKKDAKRIRKSRVQSRLARKQRFTRCRVSPKADSS